MGVLSQLDARRIQANEASLNDPAVWTTTGGYAMQNPVSSAGVLVNADAALRLATVQACIRVLAETVAYLPLQMYERIGDDDRQLARNHELSEKLAYQPNDWQTSFEWREMMMGHCALRRDAYSRILFTPGGDIDQLIPLHPDRVTPEQLSNRRIVYHWTPLNGQRQTFLQEEIFHLRGLSDDGIVGLARLNLGRDVFGTAIATEDYGAKMYRNGAQLGGILKKKSPGPLTPTARDNIYADLKKFTGSGNSFKTMLLEDDLDWTQVGMRARDAEYMLSRQFSVIEICRMFRVPPHMVQDLQRSTNNNIEHQSLEFVIYTLGPWLKRWEQAIRRDLLVGSDKQNYFAEYNVDGLLRGDIVSRYTAYGIAITNGFKTRNEVRRSENLNPLPGLDTPLRPLNMGNGSEPPADEVSAPAAKEAQFARMAARRIAAKETAAVRKALALVGDSFTSWCDEFYTGYASGISRNLIVPFPIAEEFAIAAKRTLLAANESRAWLVDSWADTRTDTLTALSLTHGGSH